MYVISLTYVFGDFEDGIVSSLTRWTLGDFDNAS